ncbi:tetratricopeptide repeat protein [Micromonospora sp. CPCC 205371]|nr:tetratricopeptide repeat protein [Micromonospora sp. CPCC 205371]
MATGVPAPSAVRTAAGFVDELRRLKAWAGLSYRDLSRLARARGRVLAYSTLATALSRDSLPQPDLVAAFVTACGGTDADVVRWLGARGAVAVAVAAAPDAPPEPPPWGSRLVPPDRRHFAGRAAELTLARRLLGAPGGGAVLVIGPAGVGKTTFAIRLGHAVAELFADGQLYVDLRGFAPSGSAVRPAEAVRTLLDALDVPADRVPSTPEAQAALYRRLLERRRVLVVLDNARDAAQIAPLLPGGGCAAVVTSRDQLAGLVVTGAADPLRLDLLTAAEAHELLALRLGEARMRAEPEAVERIVAACAGLPLALAIVAARAVSNPGFALRALADELRTTQGGLEAFTGGDPAADMRAVFSWSYRLLDPAAAHLFRLLSVHNGPDITVPAAASLAGLAPAATGRLLAALSRAHLLVEHAPGRFAMHDLLHGYAAELAAADPESERRAATRRILDHYLLTAHAADRLVDPEPVVPPCPPPLSATGVTPQALADLDAATSWLAAEREVLLVACNAAARAGFDDRAWQLARAIASYLDTIGHWHDVVATQQVALAGAARPGGRAAPAGASQALARAAARLRQDDLAHEHYERALERYAEVGDHLAQAHVHRGLGGLCQRQGRDDQASEYNQRALTLYEKLEHRNGQAIALNNAGWLHARRGEYGLALADCQRAVALLQQTGDRHAEAATWDSLGFIHHNLGQGERAAACYQHAIDLYQELGDRYNEADTLRNLAELHESTGDGDAAVGALGEALRILEELRHPEADEARERLWRAGGTMPAP